MATEDTEVSYPRSHRNQVPYLTFSLANCLLRCAWKNSQASLRSKKHWRSQQWQRSSLLHASVRSFSRTCILPQVPRFWCKVNWDTIVTQPQKEKCLCVNCTKGKMKPATFSPLELLYFRVETIQKNKTKNSHLIYRWRLAAHTKHSQ